MIFFRGVFTCMDWRTYNRIPYMGACPAGLFTVTVLKKRLALLARTIPSMQGILRDGSVELHTHTPDMFPIGVE